MKDRYFSKFTITPPNRMSPRKDTKPTPEQLKHKELLDRVEEIEEERRLKRETEFFDW